jgi:hypothetical protein
VNVKQLGSDSAEDNLVYIEHGKIFEEEKNFQLWEEKNVQLWDEKKN